MSSIRMNGQTTGVYGVQELLKNKSVACTVTSIANGTNSYEITNIEVSDGDILTSNRKSGQQGVVVIYK